MERMAIPVITVISYLAVEIVKAAGGERASRFLPVVSGLAGGILGALAHLFAPELLSASDVFTAIAVGIVSGMAATGAHQITKKLGGNANGTSE